MYVYFYLFMRAGLAKLDVSMLEAAQALGAGRWATIGRVVLPLVRPSLVGAAILTYMTALGSFSAPYIFGGGFRVMTTQIVATKLNGDLPLAMVETLALATVAVAGLLLLRRSEGDDILVALGKGTAPRPRPIRQSLLIQILLLHLHPHRRNFRLLHFAQCILPLLRLQRFPVNRCFLRSLPLRKRSPHLLRRGRFQNQWSFRRSNLEN